jgi:hypothetical protein
VQFTCLLSPVGMLGWSVAILLLIILARREPTMKTSKCLIALAIAASQLSMFPANAGSTLLRTVSIQKYKEPIDHVKEAWLSLDAIPRSTTTTTEMADIRSSLKQTLVCLYNAEHKSATANWISHLDNGALSAAIKRQKKAKSIDFIVDNLKYHLVSISPDGILWITRGGCTAMCVAPDAPTYKSFQAAVGKIEPGYLKEINLIPDDLLVENSRRHKAISEKQSK